MTRRPLSLGADERGQVESFPLWPGLIGVVILVTIALNEAVTMQRVAPAPGTPNPIQMITWTPATLALAVILLAVPAAFHAGRVAQRRSDNTDKTEDEA